MILNKSYLTAFSTYKPYVALASKGKVLDSKFKLSAELSIYNYINNTTSEIIQTENEFLTLKWCERQNSDSLLACGMSNSILELYSYDNDLKLIYTYKGFDGEVKAVDFNTSKNVIAAGSSTGTIIFINLDKPDQQYKCDIPINYSITCLSWNYKVSRILSAGTECGKILVLDIKNKTIALTIQNKEINTVYSIKWHPKFSTYIFASTNLNSLTMFKLDSNSLDKIGIFRENIINFEFLLNDKLLVYSETQLDTIDLNTFKILKSELIEPVHQISFSKKDPLNCFSFIRGQTEIKPGNFTNYNSCLQLPGHLIGNISNIDENLVEIKSYKILNEEIKLCENETEESKIIKILYENKKYKFDEQTRSELATILSENLISDTENRNKIFNEENATEEKEIINDDNIKTEEIFDTEKNKDSNIEKNTSKNKENPLPFIDVNDAITLNLVKNNIKYLETVENKSISIKFIIDLLINKKKDFMGNDYLLYILITKDYSDLVNKISSNQFKIIILILLYSSLTNEEVINLLTEFNKKLNISLINLIVNKPEKYNINSNTNLSIYDVPNFFKKYGCEFSLIKNFNISCGDPVTDEFFWYGASHGIYKELKEIKYDNKIINGYLNGGENINEDIKKLSINKTTENISSDIENSVYNSISKNKIDFKSVSSAFIKTPVSENVTKSPISTPYDNNFSAPTTYSNSTLNKPSFAASENVKPSIYSGTNKSVTSFATKPIRPSPSLYKGVNKSVTGFNTKPGPRNDSNVKTYSQLKTGGVGFSNASTSTIQNSPISRVSHNVPPGMISRPSVIPKPSMIPKPNVIPKPNIPSSASNSFNQNNNKNSIVEDSNPVQKPGSQQNIQSSRIESVAQQDSISNDELIKQFEELIDTLKQKASKKNNLIVGNKIKDATRRMSFFENNKQRLNDFILSKINSIIEIVKSEKNIKHDVRIIVDECVETKFNECDIWMPAVAILVQLVY